MLSVVQSNPLLKLGFIPFPLISGEIYTVLHNSKFCRFDLGVWSPALLFFVRVQDPRLNWLSRSPFPVGFPNILPFPKLKMDS